MEHFARPNLEDSHQKFFPDQSIIPELILGNAHNYYSDPELPEILLKLQLAVDRDQRIEHLLGGRQQRSVLKRTPALVVNRSRLMIQEKGLDPWIYALVNKDAHSRI